MILADLQQRIRADSTVMHLNRELAYMAALMALPLPQIMANWDQFDEVVERLCESHTDTFFEVTAQSRPELLRFADWLVGLACRVQHPRRQAWLISCADTFTVDPMTALHTAAQPDTQTNPGSAST